MIYIGIILLIISSLVWAFRPNVEKLEGGEWILWYSTPRSRTNRKYIKL